LGQSLRDAYDKANRDYNVRIGLTPTATAAEQDAYVHKAMLDAISRRAIGKFFAERGMA
jgi:hypothetical protein